MSSIWLHELVGVITASQERKASAGCEVKLRCGDFVCGVDLFTGVLTSGEKARSELIGNEDILLRIVRGAMTLQAAFRSGMIELSGDPEPFLRLAILLDRVSELSTEACQ